MKKYQLTITTKSHMLTSKRVDDIKELLISITFRSLYPTEAYAPTGVTRTLPFKLLPEISRPVEHVVRLPAAIKKCRTGDQCSFTFFMDYTKVFSTDAVDIAGSIITGKLKALLGADLLNTELTESEISLAYRYESVIVIRPDLEPTAREAEIRTIESLFTRISPLPKSYISKEIWGNKLLAYPIKKDGVLHKRGYFLKFDFYALPESITTIQKHLEEHDTNILKSIFAKLDEITYPPTPVRIEADTATAITDAVLAPTTVPDCSDLFDQI